MQPRRPLALVLGAALVAIALCTPPARASLYDDLGQKAGVTKVLVDMVGYISDDSRINKKFSGADIPALEGVLVNQVCFLSGGPCPSSPAMGTTLASLHLNQAQFDAIVEDLEKAMNKDEVPITEQNRLIAVLAPLYSAVTYK